MEHTSRGFILETEFLFKKDEKAPIQKYSNVHGEKVGNFLNFMTFKLKNGGLNASSCKCKLKKILFYRMVSCSFVKTL